MNNFIGNLLLTSVICSAMVLIVFAVSPLLKKYTKKWRYVVFILIAIKLLMPMPFYTAENAIVIPMARQASSTTSNITNNEVNKNIGKENLVNQNMQQVENTAEDSKVEQVKNNTVTNSDNQSAISKNVKSETTGNILVSFLSNIDMNVVYTVLFIIWCVGVVGFSFFYIFMYFYHRKTLNRWSNNVTDENILMILAEEKERLGIKKDIVIKKCKRINTPMTLGFRHLSIILPYTEYSCECIRYIFRHELTHQKRYDIYAKVLFIATKCLHWFNPIIPKMVNKAYDDMEILCDEMVVADMQQEQRIQYNETILSIAKAKDGDVTGKNILFAFCFVEKESNLKERVKNIMIMGKRKKGYQIVALAMAIIVAGSCFISCGVKKEKTAKDIYNKYIKETLIPEYGLADLSEFSTNVEINFYEHTSPNIGYDFKDREIQLDGVASAYVEDMNSDGVEDMIVIRFKVGAETATVGNMYDMLISAYTIENNKVKLLDEQEVGAHHCNSTDTGFWSETISAKEGADRKLYVSAVTNGENKYIFLESTMLYKAGADGGYEYHLLYQLKNNKLEIPYSFEQSEYGSSEFYYTGYYYDKGILTYNEYAKDGTYPSYEEAVINYYLQRGIYVDPIENKYEKRHSIIYEDSLVDRIFTYEWISSDYQNEERQVKAVFTQNAKDYTNVSKLETVTKIDLEETSTEKSIKQYSEQEIMYKKILDKHYKAFTEKWDEEKMEAKGLNYLYARYDGLLELGYTFIDIDKNGVDELFIGKTELLEDQSDNFWAMYAMIDGEISLIAESGERDNYYLCDDYIIERDAWGGAMLGETVAMRYNGTKDFEIIEAVIVDGYVDEDNPRFYWDGKVEKEMYNTPISEEAAKEFYNKYNPIEIVYTPFGEYKGSKKIKQEDNENTVEFIDDHYISNKEILDNYYTALSRMETEDISIEELQLEIEYVNFEYLEQNGLNKLRDVGYAYVDLDKSGAEVLIIGEVNDKESPIIDIHMEGNDSDISFLRSLDGFFWWMCENNILKWYAPESSYTTTTFYTLENNRDIDFVEGVMYNENKDKKNKWFYYDNQTEDGKEKPITEAEKDKVINKYKIMDIDYTPFSEYK